MKLHTKIYIEYFDYPPDESVVIPCEICGKPANDLHHIKARKSGGTKRPENIKNLMALCRGHHLQFGDKKQYMEFLKMVHVEFMEDPRPHYEKFGYNITQYSLKNKGIK